nr:tetratricopeptide repeat protein [Candidatus Sigynarchaeota archaeon]
ASARVNRNDYGIAASAFNAGLIYFYDCDIDRSESLIEEAMSIAEKHDIKAYKGPFYFQLAEIAGKKGDASKARDILTKAQACFKEVNDKDGIVSSTARMAELLSEAGSFEVAIGKIEDARRVAIEGTNDVAKADVAMAEGTLLEQQGNFEASIEAFSNGRDLYDANNKQYFAADAWERLARVHGKAGHDALSNDARKNARDRFARMGLSERASRA